jgi:hypothetical protein
LINLTTNRKYYIEGLLISVRYIMNLTSVQNKIASLLSESERKFLKDVKDGKMNDYSANYRYVLKHRILGKRKTLTNDLLLINEVLDKLQSL